MRKFIAAVTAAAALAVAPAASAQPGEAQPGCQEFGDVVSRVVTSYYTGPEPQFEGYRWGHAIQDLAHAFGGDPLGISRAGLCAE